MRGVLGKATAAEVRTAIGAINEPGVGVIAGDVSNANAWWVKLSGEVPLIIQGGFSSGYITYPIAFSSFSSVVVQGKQSGGACEFRVWNTSKTGFQTAGDRETQGLFWIAIGY